MRKQFPNASSNSRPPNERHRRLGSISNHNESHRIDSNRVSSQTATKYSFFESGVLHVPNAEIITSLGTKHYQHHHHQHQQHQTKPTQCSTTRSYPRLLIQSPLSIHSAAGWLLCSTKRPNSLVICHANLGHALLWKTQMEKRELFYD